MIIGNIYNTYLRSVILPCISIRCGLQKGTCPIYSEGLNKWATFQKFICYKKRG